MPVLHWQRIGENGGNGRLDGSAGNAPEMHSTDLNELDSVSRFSIRWVFDGQQGGRAEGRCYMISWKLSDYEGLILLLPCCLLPWLARFLIVHEHVDGGAVGEERWCPAWWWCLHMCTRTC